MFESKFDRSNSLFFHSIYLIYPDIAVTRPVQEFIIVRDGKQSIHNDFTFILQGSNLLHKS